MSNYISEKPFNEKLINLREKKDIAKTEISEEIGVSRNTYNKWENGESYPTYDQIERLAEYFKVSPKFFFRQDSDVFDGKEDSVKTHQSSENNIETRSFYIEDKHIQYAMVLILAIASIGIRLWGIFPAFVNVIFCRKTHQNKKICAASIAVLFICTYLAVSWFFPEIIPYRFMYQLGLNV